MLAQEQSYTVEKFIPLNFPLPESPKIKKAHVTLQQKECIVDFIGENPEMVTHSSTKENEDELWNQLIRKLNDLKPVKDLDRWKIFFKRWTSTVSSKPDSSLIIIDFKLKHFLTKVLPKPESLGGQTILVNTLSKVTEKEKKIKLSLEQINSYIISLEKEKSELNLELDNNEMKILKYKNAVKSIEKENVLKRKRLRHISEKKKKLNNKKRKYESKITPLQDNL